MNDCILIIDIETTGFSHEFDFIVEIGIVSLNLKTGEIVPLVDECVWEKGIQEETIVKSWIFNNSNIEVKDIRYGHSLLKIKKLIQTIINHYPLGATAFNNVFDFGFLESRGFRFTRKLDCPMKLLTDILKLPHKKRAGYKYPSVMEAYKHFFPNEEYVEKHRGLDDAIHEAKIVYEMIKLNLFKL